MHPRIPRLLIVCPADLRSFGGNDCDWEVFNGLNCLKLLISPSEYTPTITYPNGEPGYLRSLTLPQYSLRSYVAGIELKVSDERDFLFYVMQEICRRSNTITNKQDVTLFDFVLPEAQDITSRTDTIEPCTVRRGAFRAPQAAGGRIVMGGQGWIKGGFTIKFEEKRMRLK